jgi:hypothetical protein
MVIFRALPALIGLTATSIVAGCIPLPRGPELQKWLVG